MAVTPRRHDYWGDVEDRADADLPSPNTTAAKRWVRLAVPFYGALSAAHSGGDDASADTGDDRPENDPSLATCERSPTSGESDALARLSKEHGLSPAEVDALPLVFRLGVEDTERAIDIVAGGGERLSAIYAALERDEERRWKVLALLERGDVKHAMRLATCGRRSVRLGCPKHFGGCGCDENYVPLSCDSRLCPDCNDRRTGQNIDKWVDAVHRMDHPTFGTFTIENVEDPVEGRERIVDALGTLRRRTIPFAGEVERESGDGGTVTKRWCWWRGSRPEDFAGGVTQWKSRLQGAGAHDLVRRLENQYIHYQWEDITGVHEGRAIPFDEVVSGGIYGIDIKQKGPFEYNVHAHVLMDCPFIPQAALSSVWEDITGDPVVDVRRIYDRGTESIEEALNETVGYAVKPPEFEELDDELEFIEEAKGSPMVHPFGDLYGAADPSSSLLRCSRCEQSPGRWDYCGVVDESFDNMGKDWETDRGMDPPD